MSGWTLLGSLPLLLCLSVGLSAGEDSAAPIPSHSAARATQAPAATQFAKLLEAGSYAAAESLARVLVAEAEAHADDDSLQVAGAIDLLVEARIRGAKGHETETTLLAERSVRIKERKLGPGHAALGKSLVNLAEVRVVAGDMNEAQQLGERALEIQVKSLGSNDLDLVPALDLLSRLALQDGSFAKAESLARRGVAICEQAYGPDHVETMRSIVLLADSYRRRFETKKARPLYEHALAVQEGRFGRDHPDVATTLLKLGALFQSIGQHAAARPFLERAIEIREKAYGPDHPLVAWALNSLAILESVTGEGDSARTHKERVLRIYEKSLGPRHISVAVALNNLATEMTDRGDSVAARPLFERALEIQVEKLGPDHLRNAYPLSNLAVIHRDNGDYAAALKLFTRALEIRENALGPRHPDVAGILTDIGRVLRDSDDLQGARLVLERALDICRERLGPEDPNLAETMGAYAWLLYRQGEYEKARPLCEQALTINEKALGPDHIDVAWNLRNLGYMCAAGFEYDRARSYQERALAIFEKNRGPSHLDVADCASSLAYTLRCAGDYAGARRLYERALAIREKARGPEHPVVASSLRDLGWLSYVSADRAQAEVWFRRALTILENARGPDHLSLADPLYGIAWVHASNGDYRNARSEWERLIAIREKALGASHPSLMWSLTSYGNLLQRAGDYTGARSTHVRALAIGEQAYGSDNPFLAGVLSNMSSLHRCAGDNAAALPFAERALAIWEKQLGPTNVAVGKELETYGMLLAALGDSSQALGASLRAETISRDRLRIVMHSLSEREAVQYASERSSGLPMALSLAARGLDADSERLVWDALIASRGLVFDETAGRQRRIANVSRSARLLSEASTRLANLSVRGQGEETPEAHRRLLEAARSAKERAERELAETGMEARSDLRWDLTRIVSGLPRSSALVSYVRYNHLPASHPISGRPDAKLGICAGQDTIPSYLVFVLRSGETDPLVLALGTAAEIDSLVSRWSEELSRGARVPARFLKEASCRAAGDALRRKVWDPIAPYVKPASRVFVVPDGALHLVQLAALPVGDQEYLVENGPLFHYLSTERDLIEPGRSESEGKGLLAMGGPDFDHAAVSGVPSRGPRGSRGDGPSRGSGSPAHRGDHSHCGDFSSLRWSELPGTVKECEEVVSLWRGSAAAGRGAAVTTNAPASTRTTNDDPATSGNTLAITGPRATEAMFKALAPGHRVVHLATHGFFLSGSCASSLDAKGPPASLGLGAPEPSAGGPPAGAEIAAIAAGENPLVLSGLALSGANQRDRVGIDEDDGVLTAEEVAGVDLSGVEWAVLSACETAVGETRAGEGVFGLRRAFQIAGARTLIMSLWSVEDEATRTWMRSLYEARFQHGLGTAEAVREASLSVLRARRERKESTHPFYWGAFIAAGDWH